MDGLLVTTFEDFVDALLIVELATHKGLIGDGAVAGEPSDRFDDCGTPGHEAWCGERRGDEGGGKDDVETHDGDQGGNWTWTCGTEPSIAATLYMVRLEG